MAHGTEADKALQANCELLLPGIAPDPDWPHLEQTVREAATDGHDGLGALRPLVQVGGLGPRPADELRRRLVAALGLRPGTGMTRLPIRPRPSTMERQPIRQRATPGKRM